MATSIIPPAAAIPHDAPPTVTIPTKSRNFFLGLTGLTFAFAALTDWGKRQSPPEDA